MHVSEWLTGIIRDPHGDLADGDLDGGDRRGTRLEAEPAFGTPALQAPLVVLGLDQNTVADEGCRDGRGRRDRQAGRRTDGPTRRDVASAQLVDHHAPVMGAHALGIGLGEHVLSIPPVIRPGLLPGATTDAS